MEAERHYELRSRSRSRSETPQLSSRESSEHQYDLRRNSRERSNTPSGRRSSRSMALSGAKTVEKTMDTIVEQKGETPKSSSLMTTEKSTAKKVERRSERQKVKRHILANGQSESENVKSVKTESTKVTKNLTSDYSSEDTDKENGTSKPKSAYEIYKQAGEWWNVFPKTDYTYSEASQCRYEIAPGILAMPNMSRRSIHSNESCSFDSSSLSTSQLNNTSISTKESTQNWLNTRSTNEDVISINGVPQVVPHIRDMHSRNLIRQEIYYKRTEYRKSTLGNDDSLQNSSFSKFISRLNPLSHATNVRHRAVDSFMDSDNETVTYRNIKDFRSQRTTKWYQQITSIVLSLFYFCLNLIKRAWSSTSSILYLLLAYTILLDSWLLSRISPLRNRILNRRKKLLFLALLIPLLWAGLKLRETDESDTVFNEAKSFNTDPTVALLVKRIQTLENNSAQQSKRLEQLLLKLSSDCVTPEELSRVKLDFQFLRDQFEKSTVDNKLPEIVLTPADVDRQIRNMLQGYTTEEEFFKILATFATKDDLLKISDINNKGLFAENTKDCNECTTTSSTVEIEQIVKRILKIYDADKTGRVDYALESAGGQIISTRCTQRYDLKTRAFKILGWTLFYESNNPRTVIQGHPMQPGLCWAFQDFPGYLLIKTRSLIYVTGFTLEHVPKSILPNGDMGSAPRKFNVWGLRDENDSEPVLFGEYIFENSDESLQYFPVQNTNITEPYQFVELRIHSNHGRLEYTCLYRFRIHGNLV